MRHDWLAIVCAMLVIGCNPKADDKAFTAALPHRTPLLSASTIRCNGLAQSMIEDSDSASSIGHQASSISVLAKSASDAIVLNISGDKATFLTQAAFESGVASGTEFQVVSRDGRYLMAVAAAQSPQAMLNSLFIDRQEAVGVWTKTRVNPSFSSVPDSATVYLVCR